MELTKETITQLPRDEDKGAPDKVYWDDLLKGFGIRYRFGRKPVWIIQCRNAEGLTRKQTLGDANKLKAKDARAAAEKRFAEITLGGDPRAAELEAKAKAKLTLGPIASRYLEFKQSRVRASSYYFEKRYLTHHWAPFHGLPLHTITRRHVAARLGEIVRDHGPTSAARARSALSALFTWAMKEGICEGNPTIATNNPLAGHRSRDRVLTPEEIRAIWNSSREDDFGRIIRLLILTGARREEIGGLHWGEVNFDTGVMIIPGARTKNHRPLVLSLPSLALSILKSAPRKAGRELVFGGGKRGFVAWSYDTMRLNSRITEAESKPPAPWRIHDIRRSVATHMAEIGIQPHIIEAVLNHASGHKSGVAGIYNRASYEREIKTALALWGDHVHSIVSGAAPQVIPMRAMVT